jgi:hypothetical protein
VFSLDSFKQISGYHLKLGHNRLCPQPLDRGYEWLLSFGRFTSQERTPVLNRKLSGAQSVSGYCDREKSLPVQEIETDSSVFQFIALPLYQLSYPVYRNNKIPGMW